MKQHLLILTLIIVMPFLALSGCTTPGTSSTPSSGAYPSQQTNNNAQHVAATMIAPVAH